MEDSNKDWAVAQLTERLISLQEALGSIAGMAQRVHAHNPSAGELKVGRSEVQDYP